jgi:single-strand DNA-binding protein
MNHIVIMGRMTRDPELRHTQTGTPVASFTLAVDRPFSSKDGNERQTDFIDVVAWRGTAEFVSKYFAKGQLTAVSGRLQIRDWTDKDNNKRRSAEIVADNVYFTGDRRNAGGDRRDDSEQQGGGYRADSGSGYSTPASGSGFSELDDDGDLPF